MIRVLITEDSPVVGRYLEGLLASDSEITVVGTAKNGVEAVALAESLKPDVVTMDVHMPRMDGYEATRRIMETRPIPIIICSASWDSDQVSKTFQSLEAGAVAALPKPRGGIEALSDPEAQELLRTVKAMAHVKMVRRWAKGRYEQPRPASLQVRAMRSARSEENTPGLVVIGASTGGPMALRTVLGGLPQDLPVPICIVQHIASGFLHGFCKWLAESTGFRIQVAEDGQKALSGRAYVAPDTHHLCVESGNILRLSAAPPVNNLKPSVAPLFESAARVYGPKALAVMLTGMGKDGAREMALVREAGGQTIAQDAQSATVHGMAGEAIRLGAAQHVESLEAIAPRICQLLGLSVAPRDLPVLDSQIAFH